MKFGAFLSISEFPYKMLFLVALTCVLSAEGLGVVWKLLPAFTGGAACRFHSALTVCSEDCAAHCLDFSECYAIKFSKSTKLCQIYKCISEMEPSPNLLTDGNQQIRYFDDGECPDSDGYQFEISLNFCYKYYKTIADKSTAESTCANEGGHLATLASDAMYQFVVSLKTQITGETCRDVWIDGRRKNSVFEAWDGKPIQWSSWGYLEPSTTSTHACMKIEDGRDRPNCNDIALMPCSNREHFICQIDV